MESRSTRIYSHLNSEYGLYGWRTTLDPSSGVFFDDDGNMYYRAVKELSIETSPGTWSSSRGEATLRMTSRYDDNAPAFAEEHAVKQAYDRRTW